MEFIFEDIDEGTRRRPYSSGPATFASAASVSPSRRSGSGPMTSSASGSGLARKNLPSNLADVEIAPDPKRKRKTAKVTYLKNAKTPRKKKKTAAKFVWTWNKVCWLVCFGVFLRLIFMDRGVAHYYQMKNTLEQKQRNLEMIELENAELISEIHEIKVNPMYQKKLAREHLGVIAKDEYLILFAADGGPRSI